MGVDIHFKAYKNGKKIEDFHFWDQGERNYDWFNDLQGNGSEWEYDYFPVDYIAKDSPKEILDIMDEGGYYSFRQITAKDFINWADKYKPWMYGGYATELEKWEVDNKHRTFSKDCLPITPSGYRKTFCAFINNYDPALKLYCYLKEHELTGDNVVIYYYFDR